MARDDDHCFVKNKSVFVHYKPKFYKCNSFPGNFYTSRELVREHDLTMQSSFWNILATKNA